MNTAVEVCASDVPTLVVAAKNGDALALNRLFELFRPQCVDWAHALCGNTADAEDLAQTVLLQVVRKIHQVRDPHCFAGWLRCIVHRLFCNSLHKGKSPKKGIGGEIDFDNILHKNTPRNPVVDEVLRNEWCQQIIYPLLNQLDAISRQSLIEFYIQGMSLIEMSNENLQAQPPRPFVPIGTIKRRLHTARIRLRKLVEQRMQ